ncbi:MAG: hemerythrin domain-containing protein [Woeseiaceae bacterium]
MNDNVAEMLAELRKDHKNMDLLLNILEHETDRMWAGEEADYELMHDVMRYMTVYPDAVHHPKEDRVYSELKAVRQDLSKGLERIPAEHRELAELGLTLRNDIESIISGTALRRNVVVADALRYVKRLREHMHWEERDLFIRVDEMVNDGHGVISESMMGDVKDPVFGSDVEKNFAKLFENIQQALDVAR